MTADYRLYVDPAGGWFSDLARAEISRDYRLYDGILANLPDSLDTSAIRLASARAGRSDACAAAVQWAANVATVIREVTRESTLPCPRCGGEQEIAGFARATGLTGGWTTLACGHVLADESGDGL